MKNLGYLETNQSVKLSLKVQFYVKVKTRGLNIIMLEEQRGNMKTSWYFSFFSPTTWQYVRGR